MSILEPINVPRSPQREGKMLTAAQIRALKFAASGGVIPSPSPGWNVDIEWTRSESGVELFFDGDDVKLLVAAGFLRAFPDIMNDDRDVITTHKMRITDAGRKALEGK